MHDVTLRRFRLTIVVLGKRKGLHILKSVCVAVVIQHAKRMRRIILSSVRCLASPYFSTLSHKRYDFRGEGGIFEHKINVLTLSTSLYNIFLV